MVGGGLAGGEAARYAADMNAAPPPAPPPVRPVSVEEYHRMPEFNENGRRTELIHGVVIEKMPKSPLHTSTLRRITRLALAAAAPDQLVIVQDPLTLTDSEPEPDVAIVAGREGDFDRQHPATALLAVEVSVTTLDADRAKADLYAEAGIPEYWIVRPERGLVEVYTQPRDGLYRERRIFAATDGGTLVSTAVPALRLDLGTFFAS